MDEELKNRGWHELTFLDIAKSLKRGPFGGNLKKAFFVPSGYKVYEQQHAINKDFQLGTYFIDEKKYEELKGFAVGSGDYIISCSGTIGKLYRLPKDAPDGVINQALLKITLEDGLLTHSYFSYLFQSEFFQRQILSDARGTGMQNLAGMKEIKVVPVFIPPFPEQRKIVEKLDELISELVNGIANLKAAKDKLEIYRQAVLKKAFEGELTKEWREQQSDLPTADELLEQIKEERLKHYENQLTEWEEAVAKWEANGKQGKKPSKPTKLIIELKLNQHESQKLIDLPEPHWTYINIDFASSKLGDGLHGTPKYSEGDFYFINGNNLQDGKIIFKHDTKKVSQEEALKHYRELTDRTVLVSINGTLGNIAFYNNENVMLGKSACYFNLLSPINKSYIRWLIESHEFRNYAFKTATGTTIKNVPLKAMRNFIFPLCSEKEQTQIVQEIEFRLSVCDNILANIEEGLEKSEALRQSILKQAFEGKLLSEEELEACRAAPDWEPAEKLLERIKNEDKVKSKKVNHA